MKLYIGIDGGASKTRAVLINENGKTLNKITINKGTNLKEFEEQAPKLIIELIVDLCGKLELSIKDISAFGFGLAAVSFDRGRESLFKELDRHGISNKSLLINDAEAAYKIVCPEDVGILITVGTGIICIAKNLDGNFVKSAGKGHENDLGSGYWIGKETFLKLALNEATIDYDNNLLEIKNIILDKFNYGSFKETLIHISESENSLTLKASIAKDILLISDKNEVAMKIIQQATYNLSEYILQIIDSLDYKPSSELILFGNGSIINSLQYRKSLSDALLFDYPNINWVFSNLSASYGAAILAALSKDNIIISPKMILKGDYLVST